LAVVAFRRATSWLARPRLFTSSMFRSDSVVEPARAVVSATMTFWIVLIFRERTELRVPSRGTVRK
jgi:K+ transporter